MTEILKDRNQHYRECIYSEESQVTIDRFTTELQSCKDYLVRHGALPIFATVPRLSIANYNNFFVSHNTTSFLRYSAEYPAMQGKLNTTIDTINDFIYNLNKSTGVSTPFLHISIMEQRGSKKKQKGEVLCILVPQIV